ncbi:DNA/RNA non-specific endonuclease [Streptomyces sp. NBC_01197]|uniref:DNA/RNA non-specific endonuclease n=1 Tax=Streptomyces sp. NBC_01197 TaxID=2903768 RepID=UPI003FA3850F
MRGDESAGWDSEKRHNRGHLLGALLGGSNEDPRNFVTTHQFANSPVMRHCELQVQQAVRHGDTVRLRVTPHYHSDSDTILVGFTLEAHSENGFKFHAYSKDPKERRANRAQGGTLNSVTILNVPKCS